MLRRCRCPPESLRAPVPDHGLVAVRGSCYEVVGIGNAGGCLNLRLGGANVVESNVVEDSIVEQHRFLRYDAHQVADGVDGAVAQVVAVYQNGTFGRIVEARHQVGQRGLAGSRRAYQRYGFAFRNDKVDLLQHRLLPVAKTYIPEFDLLRKARQHFCAFGLSSIAGMVSITCRMRSPDTEAALDVAEGGRHGFGRHQHLREQHHITDKIAGRKAPTRFAAPCCRHTTGSPLPPRRPEIPT